MALIDNVKRITIEEFKPEDREMAEKIANYYNFFAEQVTNAINGNLDFENLRRVATSIEVTINEQGIPLQATRFSAQNGALGLNVIRADNLVNRNNFLRNSPFITFSSVGNGIYTVNHVTGLNPNEKYRLVIELIY